MKIIKSIKESSNQWIVDKIDDSDEVKANKVIKLLLNRLVPENFDEIFEELKKHCANPDRA